MTNKKGAVSKSLFIGFLFLIILIAPFVHNKLIPLKEWSVYSEYYKKHDIILNKYTVLSDNLIKNLKNESINLDQFINQSETNSINKKTELKDYFAGKKKLKKEFSFMGYTSVRIFTSEIGYKLFGLFSSILLIIFVFSPNHLKEYKYFYLTAFTGMLYVSVYWFLHTLFTKTDFEQWAYSMSFGILSIVATCLIFLFIYLFSKKENKLKRIISSMGRFIIKDAKKHVKPTSIKDYKKDYLNALKDGIS